MSVRDSSGAVVAVARRHDAFGMETPEYRLSRTKRLWRRLRWRLWRMRRSLDIETLDVFEHEISAFERAGLADLARQRTRHRSAIEALQTVARSRTELVAGALASVDADLNKAEAEADMLERKLAEHDPQFHNYA
ncbi:hypothetical protein [Humibacter albus]|uniref:hypothetical protein n=1 Tax=Humibacter albus TaxID=427754 RepID=UPI0003B640B7|nr:hypothetical protein [Humibacter albus]